MLYHMIVQVWVCGLPPQTAGLHCRDWDSILHYNVALYITIYIYIYIYICILVLIIMSAVGTGIPGGSGVRCGAQDGLKVL